MKRTKLANHAFFTHRLTGRVFDLRSKSPCFEPYCLFVCMFICLLVCLSVCLYVFIISDITTSIKINKPVGGLQILVTLCNDVRNNLTYIRQHLSVFTQFLNAISKKFHGHTINRILHPCPCII